MLCASGCGFYAAENGYCSKCSPMTSNVSDLIRSTPSPLVLGETMMDFINTKKDEPNDAPKKQENTSRCWKCTKKIGLLGFECACTFIFCKNCRHAESHSCTYDYSSTGKALIQKNNPLVNGTKLERI